MQPSVVFVRLYYNKFKRLLQFFYVTDWLQFLVALGEYIPALRWPWTNDRVLNLA